MTGKLSWVRWILCSFLTWVWNWRCLGCPRCSPGQKWQKYNHVIFLVLSAPFDPTSHDFVLSSLANMGYIITLVIVSVWQSGTRESYWNTVVQFRATVLRRFPMISFCPLCCLTSTWSCWNRLVTDSELGIISMLIRTHLYLFFSTKLKLSP